MTMGKIEALLLGLGTILFLAIGSALVTEAYYRIKYWARKLGARLEARRGRH